jgi:hypothetical protein
VHICSENTGKRALVPIMESNGILCLKFPILKQAHDLCGANLTNGHSGLDKVIIVIFDDTPMIDV